MILALLLYGGNGMCIDGTDRIEPAVLTIQSMLTKIDGLHLPLTSQRDLESILVRQSERIG